jgi:hypothetical protein
MIGFEPRLKCKENKIEKNMKTSMFVAINILMNTGKN